MMAPVQINYLAVLVAAIAMMAVGAAWYSPWLFAKRWAKLVGRNSTQMSGGPGYAVAGIGALLTAYVLAHFVGYVQATSWVDGMVTGFWVWLGFVVPTIATLSVFENRPRDLYLINIGHYLLSFLVAGAILGAWLPR